MVVPQAMAAGLPVVVSEPVGAADILIHGGSSGGIIVPPGNAAALSMALAGLVADASRRTSMGQAARDTVNDVYGWDDYIDRLVAAYERLLD